MKEPTWGEIQARETMLVEWFASRWNTEHDPGGERVAVIDGGRMGDRADFIDKVDRMIMMGGRRMSLAIREVTKPQYPFITMMVQQPDGKKRIHDLEHHYAHRDSRRLGLHVASLEAVHLFDQKIVWAVLFDIDGLVMSVPYDPVEAAAHRFGPKNRWEHKVGSRGQTFARLPTRFLEDEALAWTFGKVPGLTPISDGKQLELAI
jgi:hypothetical protein